jgi:dTDP-4-dehydrorhamnose 3,5-epimerase
MKVSLTSFKDLKIFKNNIFFDKRGFFREVMIEDQVSHKFKFNILSFSKKNVIRGLHLQLKNPQGKYVSVFRGKILDIALDLRKNSKTFGKYFSVILSSKNCKSIFIPPGFAHGFLAMDDENLVNYSCTNYRSAESELGISWDDPDLNIKWPVKNPILSKKDKMNFSMSEIVNLI